MRALLAGLGIARAAAWGDSAGGPYALATAALLPEMTAAAWWMDRWGDLAAIQAPVILWHGEQDTPPPAHSRWLATQIPRVTAHFPADEDHTNVEENNRGRALGWLKAHL